MALLSAEELAELDLDEPEDDPEYHAAAPTGPECVVCGDPITYAGRGPQPKYCAAHKKVSSRSVKSNPVKRKGATSKGTPKNSTPATAEQWDHLALVALISITWIIGRFAAGGQGLMLKPPPGTSEEVLTAETDFLSMNAEEAGPIAKMIATRITPTNFNKRYGRVVVHALEWEDVGYALWGYGKRIAPPLAERLHKPKVKEAKNGPSGQTPGSNSSAVRPRDAISIYRPPNSRGPAEPS